MTFRNQIYHGDCLRLIPQKLKNHSIDLVITDPPFNILTKTDLQLEGRTPIVQHADFDTQFETFEDYLAFTKQWLTLLTPKMKPNSTLYIFFATQFISDFLRIAESLQFIRKNVLIYRKLNPAPHIRKSNFLSAYESIIMLVKGYPTFHFSSQNQMHNVLEYALPSQKERLKVWNEDTKEYDPLHPTQKPLELIKHLIRISSDSHMLICDPFSGTGTVNIAALETSRSCIGMEKNQLFYDHANQRLTNLVTKYGKYQNQPTIERFFK